MHARDESRPLAIAIIVLQQQLPGFFIQRRLRIRVDEQTFDRHEDMSDPITRLPVLLERVHANLARRGHVRVEDLRGEPA